MVMIMNLTVEYYKYSSNIMIEIVVSIILIKASNKSPYVKKLKLLVSILGLVEYKYTRNYLHTMAYKYVVNVIMGKAILQIIHLNILNYQ